MGEFTTVQELSPTHCFSFPDLKLNLDFEALWNGFMHIPPSPPGLAACQGASTGSYRTLLDAAPITPPFQVEYLLYPSSVEDYCFTWPGPDPLPADTCAEDIFLYTSAFLNCAAGHWIDFRLCEYDQATQELKSQYWFFLPQTQSIMGNIPRIREQIVSVLSRRRLAENDHRSRFRLFICL